MTTTTPTIKRKESYILAQFQCMEAFVRNFNAPYIEILKQEKASPLIILCATLLSARTKDALSQKASENLFKDMEKPQDMLKLSPEEIQERIYGVGFYRQKAKHLFELFKILEKKAFKIPRDFDDLCKLPGVGPKTAALFRSSAFDLADISVDTHVFRLVKRLEWFNPDDKALKSPEACQKKLHNLLPEPYWAKINPVLVAFGQNQCKPAKPNCTDCPLDYTKQANFSCRYSLIIHKEKSSI